MKYSRLWVTATIVAFVVIIGFVLSVPHTKDAGRVQELENAAISVPNVSLRDSFKKGVHTITGSVETSNACMIVTARATLAGEASSTRSILVELSLPKDSGICLQIPTRAPFTVTMSAPARLPITVTVNGTMASTTSS